MIQFKAKKEQTLFEIKNADGEISSKWLVTIGRASYDWVQNIATIELIMQEDQAKFKHSRSFDIPADGEVTSRDIETRVAAFLGENFELLTNT